MKNLILFSIILFFFCIFKNPAFSSDKIAIIDFDVLLEKTNYGKQIISDLNLLNEQNLKSLKQIESEIKLSQDDIKTPRTINEVLMKGNKEESLLWDYDGTNSTPFKSVLARRLLIGTKRKKEKSSPGDNKTSKQQKPETEEAQESCDGIDV